MRNRIERIALRGACALALGKPIYGGPGRLFMAELRERSDFNAHDPDDTGGTTVEPRFRDPHRKRMRHGDGKIKRTRDGSAWLASVLTGVILAAGLIAPSATALAGEWPTNAYVLQVEGLACPYCGYGVEKQFRQHDGVKSTDIDLEHGVVIVTVAPGTRFSDSELERIVDDAGFELGGVKQRPGGE